MRVLPIIALLTVILPGPPAQASHQGIYLELTPEVQTVPVGSSGILVATLVASQNRGDVIAASADTTIRLENESGVNDHDGTSRTSPDFTCVVPAGASTCSIEIAGNRTGDSLFRAWIDSDLAPATDNSDINEGRFANANDCEQNQDSALNCSFTTDEPPSPGSGCQTAIQPGGEDPQPPTSEPDCTDVVRVSFRENSVGTLDCDDSGPPDTEREWNPSGNGSNPPNPSTEIYTCLVEDQFGNPKPDTEVFGEILGGPNDPDRSPDFTSPDFTCTTVEDDLSTPAVDERGTCTRSVGQPIANPQKGLALICFWVGSLSDGIELCTEKVDDNTRNDGSDSGDDPADVVELVWENIKDLTIDCSPETGIALVDSTDNVRCTALSRASLRPVEGITIRAEVSGANDPDESDSPHTQDVQRQDPDLPQELTCETDRTGSCSIPHRGSDEGETTYRAWIDDGTPQIEDPATSLADADIDLTERHDEKGFPGSTDEPDATDVVTVAWGQGPTKIEMSFVHPEAAVGECHEITIAASDKDGAPVGGIAIDIEQRHELSRNSTPRDEPIVGFCTPDEGPNPSPVDTGLGDLASSDQDAATTSGTAGGETIGSTDDSGQITIGVMSEPANGSDGSGTVYVTTWWEDVDDDDPGGGDPMDSGLVVWAMNETTTKATLDLTPDTSGAEPGSETTYVATVTHGGVPAGGIQIAWSSKGSGTFTWTDAATDADGRASATVTSEDPGTMTVTATCMGRFKCSDSSTHNWGPTMCDIVGTDGADILTGTDASEVICGLMGDDIIDGGGGDDSIIGGPGNDQVKGGGGKDELSGGGGKDTISGGTEADAIFGEGGDDTITGGSGDDILYGDEGRDWVSGNSGDDKLIGGLGPDKLFGGDGNDALRGGGGNDQLIGGSGSDTLLGQKGRDTCREDSAKSQPKAC